MRRAVALFVALTWIAGSLICPVPALAHDTPAHAEHSSALTSHGHEHSHVGSDSHSSDQSDLCCDILGQIYTAADSLNNPLNQLAAPDHAPLVVVSSILVAAAVTDEANSLKMYGSGPPRRSWPQLSKIRSHAPPADRI